MISLTVYSFVLLISVFSLGGLVMLYMKYRTQLLLRITLFLLSLLFISAGFWCSAWNQLAARVDLPIIDFVLWLSFFAGSAINVIVTPLLVSALLEIPLHVWQKRLTLIWNGAFVGLAVVYFLRPLLGWIPWVLTVMQVATIAVSLTVMGLLMRKRRTLWWFSALLSFFGMSVLFLLLLVLDILITTVPIPMLAVVDDLSLALYLVALALGLFFFASHYLTQQAVVSAGRLTEHGKSRFQLTDREVQIVECLVQGQANKQIADALHIAPKTVENHLTAIYQKTNVRNRTQLTQVLLNWNRS